MIGMVAKNPKDDNTNEIGGALIAFCVGKLRVGGESQFQQPEAMKEITGNWQDGEKWSEEKYGEKQETWDS